MGWFDDIIISKTMTIHSVIFVKFQVLAFWSLLIVGFGRCQVTEKSFYWIKIQPPYKHHYHIPQ